MDPSLIAAGAQAAAGVVQTVQGFIQAGQAKRIMAKNPRPKYYKPKEIMDNQRISESRAGQGMSDAARNTFIQEQQRGLTSSIEAILKGGGSVNNIADIYGNFQSGVAKMSIIDDEMRSLNIKNLISQNNELAAYKDKEWQVNVFAPYADKAQAAAALKKQSSENIWKGVNTIGSAASNYATSQQYQNEADRVFGETQRVNNAYIENMGNTPPIIQNNIMPVQQQQNGAVAQMMNNGFLPQQPTFNNPSTNYSGGYNWYMPNSPVPAMPQQQQQQPSVYETIQFKYPGLMWGNGGFLKR